MIASQISDLERVMALSDEKQRSSRRWMVGVMLFLAAVLNYIDRSVLGIVAPTMQKDLGINNQHYAWIIDGFLVAYMFSYLFSGRLVDRIGSRLSMGLFVGLWSLANAMTGLARGAWSLGAYRFGLGLGEAGGYTGSPKAVSEWFAPKERAFAIGLYSIGGSIGATVAPLLVVYSAASFGWHVAFVITGALGALWILPWFWVARPLRPVGIRPSSDPIPGDAAPAAVPLGADAILSPTSVPEKPSEWMLWRSILKERAVWQLMIARLLTDAVWYFYIFWMPKYLHDVRGVSQEGMGVMVFIFLAADAGFLGGGFLSDRLVKRGLSPRVSRVWLMALAACLVPASALIPSVAGLPLVLACAALVAFAHCTWLGNISTLVVDIIPSPRLATTFGLIAAGSAAGGIAMNSLVSGAVGTYSYAPAFYVMSCLHPLALLLIWPLRRAKQGPNRD